jgi:hypothetical protein
LRGIADRPKAQRKRKEACFQRDENKILAFRSLRTKDPNAENGVADGSFQQYVRARVYMRTRAAAAPTAQPVGSWLLPVDIHSVAPLAINTFPNGKSF